MNYNKTIGVSYWNRDLDSYNAGTGPYWVPDPPIGATVTQMRIAKNNAELKRKSIQDMIDTIPQDPWDLAPMMQLINLLSQKIFTYESVIAEMTATPPPLPSTEPRPEETDELPVEPEKKSNMTLLLIAGGLGALYFIGKSRKKKVSGANDDLVMIGLGIGTLMLLAKKKTAPAEPTEQTTT